MLNNKLKSDILVHCNFVPDVAARERGPEERTRADYVHHTTSPQRTHDPRLSWRAKGTFSNPTWLFLPSRQNFLSFSVKQNPNRNPNKNNLLVRAPLHPGLWYCVSSQDSLPTLPRTNVSECLFDGCRGCLVQIGSHISVCNKRKYA